MAPITNKIPSLVGHLFAGHDRRNYCVTRIENGDPVIEEARLVSEPAGHVGLQEVRPDGFQWVRPTLSHARSRFVPSTECFTTISGVVA
jgi:hypothetical protein